MHKIELITDGRGNVMLFVDGEPVDEYICNWHIDPELEDKLRSLLCMYPGD
jgi:hypothetical protein